MEKVIGKNGYNNFQIECSICNTIVEAHCSEYKKAIYILLEHAGKNKFYLSGLAIYQTIENGKEVYKRKI
jgi:hypothetical protein